MECVLFGTHSCYLADGSFHVIIKKVNIYEAMKAETINRKGEWHMAALKKLPIGIENFEEMRREGFYYVDKTRLIEQLLAQWAKVNLFTRPRRFGKSLNMSMFHGQDVHYETVKEWYDGYRFGSADVYCPWDVINYCSDHRADDNLAPKNYWANTSGNNVISHFIDSINEPQKLTKIELERLVNGGMVQKEINEELTYKDLYASIENLWSTLFMTGYLTQRGEPDGNRYNLVIPNMEIRNIITTHILKIFKERIKDDGETVDAFCRALLNRKPEVVEHLFTEYMKKTVSIRDTFVKKPTKENFYHGLLLGILGYKENWSVSSNRESGDGFADILIQIEDENVGIVIEVKYAEDGNLEKACENALEQIVDRRYTEALAMEDIHTILKYGIACYKKKCKVVMDIAEI